MKDLFTRSKWPITTASAFLVLVAGFGLWGVRLAADPTDELAIKDDLEMPAWIERSIDPVSSKRPEELDRLVAELDTEFGRNPLLTASEQGGHGAKPAVEIGPRPSTWWPTVRAIIQVGGARAALLDTCIVHAGEAACGVQILEIEEGRVLIRKGAQKRWIKLAAGEALWGSVE